MRWYYIKFIPTANAPIPSNGGDFLLEYGTQSANISFFGFGSANLPGALEVDFDIEVAPFDQMQPNSVLKIYNPPQAVIDSAQYYQGMQIEIYAGFAITNGTGFPLANPINNGLLAKGTVVVSYANWVGGDMCLQLLFGSSLVSGAAVQQIEPGRSSAAKPIVFKWNKDIQFKTALENALKPVGITEFVYSDIPEFNLKDQSYLTVHYDMLSFSTKLREITADIQNKPYTLGVWILQKTPTQVQVVGGTKSAEETIEIYADQIIGQPTVSYAGGDSTQSATVQIQSVHPMRADVKLGNWIQLKQVSSIFQPGTPFIPSKSLSAKDKQLFVTKVRHLGKFRDASHQGWVTVITSSVDMTKN